MKLRKVLTAEHFRGLKDHKYRAEGISVTEVFMQPFWRWLVERVPLWVAPNLLTFVGLMINLVTSVLVVIQDPKLEGKSPWWAYILCGLGLFVYQSLDAIDGKQARRTGTNNQLGEIFDHGCDAISVFCVAMAGSSAAALGEYPYVMLMFVMMIEVLNYVYHWQTYVSGILYFKKIDCTEAQFCHIGVMMTVALFGPEFWKNLMPGFGVPLKVFLVAGVILPTLVNLLSSVIVVFTEGKGKNGSTVADTSVLSPIIPLSFLVLLPFYCALSSPGNMLENHPLIFLTVMAGPIIKFVIYMMISGMCKTPLPFFDFIMLSHLVLTVNVFFGSIVPEYYLFLAALIFVLYDTVVFCVAVVDGVCNYLDVSCFTIPYTPPSSESLDGSTNSKH